MNLNALTFGLVGQPKQKKDVSVDAQNTQREQVLQANEQRMARQYQKANQRLHQRNVQFGNVVAKAPDAIGLAAGEVALSQLKQNNPELYAKAQKNLPTPSASTYLAAGVGAGRALPNVVGGVYYQGKAMRHLGKAEQSQAEVLKIRAEKQFEADSNMQVVDNERFYDAFEEPGQAEQLQRQELRQATRAHFRQNPNYDQTRCLIAGPNAQELEMAQSFNMNQAVNNYLAARHRKQ